MCRGTGESRSSISRAETTSDPQIFGRLFGDYQLTYFLYPWDNTQKSAKAGSFFSLSL
jgi:hypothetical protein